MSYIETQGGKPSRSQTYLKLLDLIRQCEEQAAIMAHLHQTEGNNMDQLLAKGWIGVSGLFNRLAIQVTDLASGKLLQ